MVTGEELGMPLGQQQFCRGGVVADTVGMGKTAQVRPQLGVAAPTAYSPLLSQSSCDGHILSSSLAPAGPLQVIALMLARPRDDSHAPVVDKETGRLAANNLVITPGHLCRQWESEIKRCAFPTPAQSADAFLSRGGTSSTWRLLPPPHTHSTATSLAQRPAAHSLQRHSLFTAERGGWRL